MSVEVERIKIVIEGDDSGIKKIDDSVEGARKSVRQLGDDAKKMLADIRTSAAAAAGELARSLYEGLTKPAIEAAKSWIEAGSDIGEQLSKVNTLLGKSGAEIDAWSKQTATALGVSRREALTFAGTFAGIFRPMGFNQATTTKMSKSLVQLAADMASFNNTTVKDALDAIRSGLNGEADPLQRFGVQLNETTLKLEAMKLGLIKTTKEGLSPAQKAAAAYSLILKQTSIAQGDVSRTAGGLANQQRFLKAELADLTAELGARFVPVALSAVRAFREGLQLWSAIPAPLQNVALAITGVLVAIGPLVLGYRQMVVVGGLVKETLSGLVPILRTVAAAVGLSLGELGLVLAAVAAAAGALYLAWRTNFGGIRDLMDSVWASVSPIFEAIGKWFVETLPTALAYASVALRTAGAGWQILGETLRGAWDSLKSFAGVFLAWAQNLVTVGRGFATGISMAFGALWQYLLDTTPLGTLVNLFERAFGAIREVVLSAVQSVIGSLNLFFETLAKATGADQYLANMRTAFTAAEMGLSAMVIMERDRISRGLDSIKKVFAGFKLPAMPTMPGLANNLDFKGMNLPTLPTDPKADKDAKKHADDLKRRMEQLNEQLMRLTLDRYSFERWQAQEQFNADIKLGVDRKKAQEILSAALRKINAEEGDAHQKTLDGWIEAENDANAKRLKGWEKAKDALLKGWRGYNDSVEKFNKEQAEAFAREQKEAAEEVAKGLEKTASTSEHVREAMKDLASQFDMVGGRASYFEDTLAKLNLQNQALTDEQRAAVQVYANAWQELDRIHERQKAIAQTASELQGVFKNAFAAGLKNAKDFTKELVSGVKEAIYRQLAEIASAYVVKQLMNLFGMKNNGLADSARSARNDILIASAALALSAEALRKAAAEARKAAGESAGAAAGTAIGGPIGGVIGAIFGGLFADGTSHLPPGRSSIVGERGAEIVTMTGHGASVTPIGRSAGGGGDVNIYIHGGLHGMGGTEQLKRDLRRSLAVGR